MSNHDYCEPAVSKVEKSTVGKSDRAHDILRTEGHPLDPIFAPRSVAVVGASERAGSVGRNVLWNLLSSPFGGTLYPGQSQATQCSRNQVLSQPHGFAGAVPISSSSPLPRRAFPS